MLASLKAKSPKARARKQANDAILNQALVSLASGDFDEAASLAQKVLDAKAPTSEAQIRAQLLLIQTQTRQGLFTSLFDQVEVLFQQVPKSNPSLQALVGNEVIFICQRSGNLGLGVSRGEEMLRQYGQSWPGTELIELLCQVSGCHFHRGDNQRAEELAEHALSLAELENSPKGKAQALWQTAALSELRGDLPLALQQVEEANKWARHAGLRRALMALKNNAAAIMLESSEPDLSAIRKLGEESYLEALGQNNTEGIGFANSILSEVALRSGDYDVALAKAREGLAALPAGIFGARTALAVQVAKVLARKGNYLDAERELNDATTHMEQQEPSRELAKQWGEIARVFVEVGLSDRGVYAYEKAIQMSGLLREEQESYIDR